MARPIACHHSRLNVLIYYGTGQDPLSVFYVPVEDLLSIDFYQIYYWSHFCCCVEDVEEIEIEDLTVFKVLAVCEELDHVFFDGAITFVFGLSDSRVGMSVSSIQVNKVCFSTELKIRLPTLAYDFCVGE